MISTLSATSHDLHGYKKLAASKGLLGTIRHHAFAIISFLDKFSPEKMLSETMKDIASEDTPKHTLVAESYSILALKNLVVRSAEG